MQRKRKIVLIAALFASLGAGLASAQSGPKVHVPDPDEVKRAEIQFAGRVPTLNNFGEPGILDMPSAEMLPDGQLAAVVSGFGGQYKVASYFQVAPWLGFAFRYSGIRNTFLNTAFDPYYDRGFDVRFRLAQEGRLRPSLVVGLRDFAGTGVYSSEYVAATKTFSTPGLGSAASGRLTATVGLGWGRMGSYNPIGSTGEREREFNEGGQLQTSTWFRGDYAPFAGIEWQATPRLWLKADYSSDEYEIETILGDAFNRNSPLNFGVEYQWTRRSRIGLNYMFGDAVGFRYEFNFDPRVPIVPMQIFPAQRPVERRPSRSADPGAYATNWVASQETQLTIKEKIDGSARLFITGIGNNHKIWAAHFLPVGDFPEVNIS